MNWREALLYKAKRERDTAQHNLRVRDHELNYRYYRHGLPLPDHESTYYDLLEKTAEDAVDKFSKLEYEINKLDGPNNFFGYRDEWMLAWDYESNWIECFIRNTPPQQTIDLLLWLEICPEHVVTDHWDGRFHVDKTKTMSPTYLKNVETETGYRMQLFENTPDEWFAIVMKQHSSRVNSWIMNTY